MPNTSQPSSALWTTTAEYVGFVAVLGILCAIFGSMSENFLTVGTITTIANQIPALLVVSVGMTLVLIIAGIDLSVGSILAVSAAVTGVLIKQAEWSITLAAMAGLLTGTVVGAINGSISVLIGIPSFIVTLGMLEIARGATYRVTDSQSIYIGSKIEGFSEPLKSIGVSPAFLVAVGVVVLGQFVLSRTTYGRYCRGIGGNREAVRLSGVDTRPYEIATFAILGCLCALGGLMQLSKIPSVDPNAGVGLELLAIAAAVIGGTSLAGGRGSIVNTFFGVLIIQVLTSGLSSVGAEEADKRIITGTVIVAAVILDAYRTGLRRWLSSLLGSKS